MSWPCPDCAIRGASLLKWRRPPTFSSTRMARTSKSMEITKRQSGDYAEMKVAGRLDGYWSDHLAAALEETVRGGTHSIRLDLGAVDYISSLGISVLLRFHKEL